MFQVKSRVLLNEHTYTDIKLKQTYIFIILKQLNMSKK